MDQTVPKTVDIIIAGGGSSGCVLAARLASSHPTLSILLVEGGPSNKNNPQIIYPALFLSNLLPGSKTARSYVSNRSENVAGRSIPVAAGGCLGGGGSVNFMMYLRPSATDFDDWEMEGWGSEDLVPIMQKMETFHIKDEKVDRNVHGYEGSFHTSQGGLFHQDDFVEDFLKASSAAGWERKLDIQDFKTGNAFAPLPSWIHPQTGLRQDAAHTLVHPLLESNTTKLEVLTGHEVIRVIFDSKSRATGIEVLSRQAGHEKKFVINARKLVVLSAGALGSPLILERSGIGRKELATELQLSSVFVNQNVGQNYQDHNLILYPYRSSAAPETTLDGLLSGRLTVPEALSQNTGILKWNGIEGCGKIRPTDEEVVALGPEFKELWEHDFGSRPEKPLAIIAISSGLLGDHSKVPPGQYLTLATISTYPYSKGFIHTTGKTVKDAPNFNAAIFKHGADIAVMLWAYKKQREVARRMSHYLGPVESFHPAFAEGSKASFGVADQGILLTKREEIQDVEYSPQDDEVIVKFLRENISPSWHSLGTCAMNPPEKRGVVDGSLNVYGVYGLKVADLSIVPKMVGANTYSTALMVGEKAAEIILGELKVESS